MTNEIVVFDIIFTQEAQKEFLNFNKDIQKLLITKINLLKEGNFNNKPLKGKFRKKAVDYRIIHLKENNILLISIIKIGYKKEAY